MESPSCQPNLGISISVNREDFLKLLPSHPYCADDYEKGVHRHLREYAIRYRNIQPNSTNLVRFLVFDIDRQAGWYAWEEARLPYPTFVSCNPENGHAHIGYELACPVSVSTNSSVSPIEFLESVRRGFTRRMDADTSYGSFLCKNACHPAWLTSWIAKSPYELSRLADSLDKADKRAARVSRTSGFGRNCATFDAVRKIAYRNVLKYKKSGKMEHELRSMLETVAIDFNRSFEIPLTRPELFQIAKSVSKWVWEEFTFEKFSAIQSARAKKGLGIIGPSLSETRPWEKDGISRRTWFRRKKASIP